MADVSIRDLRNNGGEVVDRAARGEPITITRAGKRVAELRPLSRPAWPPALCWPGGATCRPSTPPGCVATSASSSPRDRDDSRAPGTRRTGHLDRHHAAPHPGCIAAAGRAGDHGGDVGRTVGRPVARARRTRAGRPPGTSAGGSRHLRGSSRPGSPPTAWAATPGRGKDSPRSAPPTSSSDWGWCPRSITSQARPSSATSSRRRPLVAVIHGSRATKCELALSPRWPTPLGSGVRRPRRVGLCGQDGEAFVDEAHDHCSLTDRGRAALGRA